MVNIGSTQSDKAQPENKTMLAYGWIVVAVAVGFPSIFYWADRVGFGVILKPLLEGLSLPFALAGGLATIFALGQFIAAPASGVVSRKLGLRNTLILGIGLFSVFTIITGVSTNSPEIFTARTITGVGEAFFFPVALSIVGMMSHRYRGTAIGVVNLLQGVGVFTGPVLYAFIYTSTLSWRMTLIIAGVLGLVVMVAAYALLTFPKASKMFLSPRNREKDEIVTEKDSSKRGLISTRSIFGTVIMALLGFIQWPWLVLLSTYLQSNGFTVVESAGVTGIIGIGFILAVLGGQFGDRVNRMWPILIGSIGEIVATYVIFGTNLSVGEAVLVAAIFGVSTSAFAFTNVLASLQNSVPRRSIPIISGIGMSAYYGTGFVSGFIVGSLVGSIGWLGAMTYVVIIPAGICVLLSVFLREKPKIHENATTA